MTVKFGTKRVHRLESDRCRHLTFTIGGRQSLPPPFFLSLSTLRNLSLSLSDTSSPLSHSRRRIHTMNRVRSPCLCRPFRQTCAGVHGRQPHTNVPTPFNSLVAGCLSQSLVELRYSTTVGLPLTQNACYTSDDKKRLSLQLATGFCCRQPHRVSSQFPTRFPILCSSDNSVHFRWLEFHQMFCQILLPAQGGHSNFIKKCPGISRLKIIFSPIDFWAIKIVIILYELFDYVNS